MIWKSIPDQSLMSEALQMVETLANGPTVGLGLTKAAIQSASNNTLDAQLDLEAGFQRSAVKPAITLKGCHRSLKSANQNSAE